MNHLPEDLENLTGQESGPTELYTPPQRFSDFQGYQPPTGLVNAIKVALLLRKPLLLTGRPGTGKTELGHYLGWKMGLQVHQFNCKSTSQARDLFYVYDAIRHYRSGDSALKFITFDAMGKAILLAAEMTEEIEENLPGQVPKVRSQSVVIVDEIDKTPRDFPNDILNEIDNSYFRIPELNNVKVGVLPKVAPIVVITSNSEKNLPGAFLRRCVYYNVPFPDSDALRKIVSGRVRRFADEKGLLLNDMITRFNKIAAESSGLRHTPGTAELLDWALALSRSDARTDVDFSNQKALLKETAGALIKSAEDTANAFKLLGIPE